MLVFKIVFVTFLVMQSMSEVHIQDSANLNEAQQAEITKPFVFIHFDDDEFDPETQTAILEAFKTRASENVQTTSQRLDPSLKQTHELSALELFKGVLPENQAEASHIYDFYLSEPEQLRKILEILILPAT